MLVYKSERKQSIMKYLFGNFFFLFGSDSFNPTVLLGLHHLVHPDVQDCTLYKENAFLSCKIMF